MISPKGYDFWPTKKMIVVRFWLAEYEITKFREHLEQKKPVLGPFHLDNRENWMVGQPRVLELFLLLVDQAVNFLFLRILLVKETVDCAGVFFIFVRVIHMPHHFTGRH